MLKFETKISEPLAATLSPLEPKVLSVNGDNEYIAMTREHADGRFTSFIELNEGKDNYDQRRITACVEDGYTLTLIPAAGEHFSEDEATRARGFEYSPSEVKNPLEAMTKRSLVPHNVVLFEPTAKAILDAMIIGGDDSVHTRELRKLVLHDKNDPRAQAAMVLLEQAPLAGYSEKPITPAQKALGQIFGKRLSPIQAIEEGIHTSLEHCAQKIESGASPKIIMAIGSGDSELTNEMSKGWADLAAYALEHNHDTGGPYVELHMLGDHVVPLAAPLATGWYSRTPMGYVSESSGHTLAEIISEDYEHGSSNAESWQVIGDLYDENTLTMLMPKLKLNPRTLVGRGRLQDIEEKGIRIKIDASEYSHFKNRGWPLLGKITKQLDEQFNTKIELQTQDEMLRPTLEKKSRFIDRAHTSVEHILIPRSTKHDGIYNAQLIAGLGGVSSSDAFIEKKAEDGKIELSEVKDHEFQWLYGQASRHDTLYEQKGAVASEPRNITIDGKDYALIARMQPDATGSITCFWFISGKQAPTGHVVTILEEASKQLQEKLEIDEEFKAEYRYSADPEKLSYKPIELN